METAPVSNRSMPPGGIIPELSYPDLNAAVEWLCRVFGFRERLRIGSHRAQLVYDGVSIVAVGRPGGGDPSAADAGMPAHSIMLRVADVDRHYQQSVRGGALILNPPATYPFGERQYSAQDIAGHRWSFSQSTADVDPAEWGGVLIAPPPDITSTGSAPVEASGDGASADASVVQALMDREGEQHPLGISVIHFKVTRRDNPHIFVIENVFHSPGGPARHLHYAQDEYFYAAEGSFVIEVGDQRFNLSTGDSLLAPRGVPHVWAFTGEGRGRMLITFTPPGKMEDFFRIVARENAMPVTNPALFEAHGMQLLGPPLKLT